MKTVIIGGGAAGMMAAVFAKEDNNEVIILEKNEKLGKKLFITGKGRCNYANNADFDKLIDSVVTNNKFMYSSFRAFSNIDVIRFFEDYGLKGKVERGGRVFPVSDKSSDVLKALERAIKSKNVTVRLNTEVKNLIVENDTITGVKLTSGEVVKCDKCIVATGGMSYQSTGSTGDGYKWATETGHKVEEIGGGLTGLNVKEDYPKKMQGLSLKNIEVSIYNFGSEKAVFREFGEMLFSHFGVTGPVILTASSYVGKKLKGGNNMRLVIDFKPSLDRDKLDQRLLREIDENPHKSFRNMLKTLLPEKALDVFVERTGINKDTKAGNLTRVQREKLIDVLKNFELTITGTRPVNESIITRGGVSVKDLKPKTFESKHVNGLYFIGEVIDVDAITGGFNLQIAWSSAYVAGTDCRSES